MNNFNPSGGNNGDKKFNSFFDSTNKINNNSGMPGNQPSNVFGANVGQNNPFGSNTNNLIGVPPTSTTNNPFGSNTSNLIGVPPTSTTNNPFGSNTSNLIGVPPTSTTNNPFGSNTNNLIGVPPTSTTNNPFGSNTSNLIGVPPTSTTNNPFGSNTSNLIGVPPTSTTNNPFGSNTSNLIGVPPTSATNVSGTAGQTNPFGNVPSAPATGITGNTSQFNQFGSNSFGQSANLGTQASAGFNPNSTLNTGSGSFFGGNSKPMDTTIPKIDSITSISSHGNLEKSATFLQMTLNEIIQQQTRKLAENIKSFKEKAKEVFEQDEKIIKAINNYKLIKNMLDDEEKIITETEENVEFYEKRLLEFLEGLGEVEGDYDELATCLKMVEEVNIRFNNTLEGLKDEEDEIMCLVNENYNLINLIDEKIDVLESINKLKLL